jgi:hypothetical protein
MAGLAKIAVITVPTSAINAAMMIGSRFFPSLSLLLFERLPIKAHFQNNHSIFLLAIQFIFWKFRNHPRIQNEYSNADSPIREFVDGNLPPPTKKFPSIYRTGDI